MSRIDNENERYNITKDIVENITKNGLGVIASFINRIELSHGRLAGNEEHKDNQIITLEHLEELEKTYVSKINKIIQSESIIDINHLHMVHHSLFLFFLQYQSTILQFDYFHHI